MDIETLRNYCLSKLWVTESLPFGPNILVFKVSGKVFAICDIDLFESINLKCEPVRALELRQLHPEWVQPGWHMNKKHWNTVRSNAPSSFLIELIDHSYACVVGGFSKKKQQELGFEN